MQWDHLDDMDEVELRNALDNLEADYKLAEEVHPGAGAPLVKKMLKIAHEFRVRFYRSHMFG